jgi:hypothetical protein
MGPVGREDVDAAGPAAKRLPAASTFMPPGAPFFVRVQGVASKKTWPPPRVPSGARS